MNVRTDNIDTMAQNVLSYLDAEGRGIPLEDWVAVLDIVTEGVKTRLDAAKEDLEHL